MKRIIYTLCIFAFLGCKTVSGVSSLHNKFLQPPIQYDGKKDVMIFFTGSDWDTDSKRVVENLFTDEFYKKYSPFFNIYSIDITRARSNSEDTAIQLAYQYFAEYEITECPCVALETSSRYVYALENIKAYCDSIESFDTFLQAQMPKRETLIALENSMQKAKGPELTKEIDAFLAEVKLPYSHRYDSLIIKAFESDPKNETGLYKKYFLAYTDIKAQSFMNNGDPVASANEFISIAENEIFSANEKQANYYTAAYFLALTDEHLETVLEYLEKALSLNPKSELADQIKNAIRAVNQRHAETSQE